MNIINYAMNSEEEYDDLSDTEDDEFLELIGLYLLLKKKRLAKKRGRWCRPWLLERNRYSHVNLLNALRVSEPHDFRNYLRMDENTYTTLLHLVENAIVKEDTVMRAAITAHERLCVTLRYLATGRSYKDLEFSSAISVASLSHIIPETCLAIYNALKDYIKFPNSEEEWKTIADDFERLWQFPLCLGAIDGKHISIIPPKDSGSFYYNYKGFHSIVLMAIANANLEFILCDIGTNGRISDGGVINNTQFHEKLLKNELPLPPAKEMDTKLLLNYTFIGDEAFAMRSNLLKPYSQRELDYEKRIFNYRLSRARRTVENVFGILVKRFQVFGRPISLQINRIKIVVLACCALHNFLRRRSQNYVMQDDIDIEDHSSGSILRRNDFNCGSMVNLQNGHVRNSCNDAKKARDEFKKYFVSEKGKVPWQDKMISPT